MFYATALDLGTVLSKCEAKRALQYTLVGLFPTSSPQTYFSYTAIPNFGQASYPNAIANSSYLICDQGSKITVREIPQKEGGVRFAVDQLGNSDTVVLRPGGWYGNSVILCGLIGTIATTDSSKNLYRELASGFRVKFRQKNKFFVGEDAYKAWNSGARLTIGAASPPDFDLSERAQ